MLNPIRRALGDKSVPLLEMRADKQNPLGIKVLGYHWSNPDELLPGIKNPFVLLLNLMLEVAETETVTISAMSVDIGSVTLEPRSFEPVTVTHLTTLTPRFVIPYESAIRPLGPALILTANGTAIRTKRFRVPAVPT